MSNKEKVQQQFGRAADDYANSDVHAQGESLGLLLELTEPQPDWQMLDVATGAGHTAIAFAPYADWNAAWPVPPSGAPNPLLDRVIVDPELLKRYRSAARDILEEYFEPERLCKIIDTKYNLIKQALQSDPFPHRRATVPGDRNH